MRIVIYLGEVYTNALLCLRLMVLWSVVIPVDLKSKQRISLPLGGLKIIIGLCGAGVPKSTCTSTHSFVIIESSVGLYYFGIVN